MQIHQENAQRVTQPTGTKLDIRNMVDKRKTQPPVKQTLLPCKKGRKVGKDRKKKRWIKEGGSLSTSP